MSSGMICDGVAASEAIDSSGEVLDVTGCDISDFEEGRGTINWEHRGDEASGASANDIVGRILFAKKIFSAEDCTDDRQLRYYQELKLPMIYIIYRLFDGSNHPGAIALAAIIRDCKKNGEKNLIGLSIEGTTLKKDKSSNRLLESVARRVAATQKPCNKSALSNVISDPQDTDVQKKEHQHPLFTQLTDSVAGSLSPEVESETIKKALEAGSYNTAPGNLTGGSALQVEDRSLRNRVKAAVRDWDKKTPFKKFLKHRLPEASDEFLGRFSDLVEDYTIKKAQRDVIKAVVKKAVAEKVQAKAKAAPPAHAAADERLTIRSVPLNANPEGTKASFDEKKGVLHTPRGSFPMYIPSRDKQHPDAGQTFANIMNDPKVSKFHDYAMENWTKVHQHLKAGTLPPEVVMHGVIFSQLSPNTPVPMQELMYAHLVDAMRHTGKDPRSKEGLDVLRADWLKRDQPQRWPDHSRDHFQRLEDQLRMKNDSKGTGRVAGDIGSFMLANNKFKNMEKYHTLHNSLVDLIGRHRHDARSGVEELMFHKKQSGLWDAKRRRDISKGKEDPGPYTAGPDVPGLAPKTARYTYGMLGGGNVTVPDTHFVRYLFGLDRQHDTPSIDYIKSLLWNEGNSHVLNGIDRYYAKHHDAVKHMQSHPTWGKHFEKPEDAVFPAFWKNWVGILPHEHARGMKTNGWNESTDHRPFWDAVGPYLRKTEDGVDTNIALRTAKTHHEWVQKYGEMPALLMYYRFLVPQLLEAGAKRQQEQTVTKFEALAIDLRKGARSEMNAALDQSKASAAMPAPPETVRFNDKTVKPGEAYTFDGKHAGGLYLIDHTPEHYVAVPKEKVYDFTADDLIKLPRKGGASTYRVLKPPEHLEAPSVVSHEVHGVPEYTHHQEVKDLIHGLDLSQVGEPSDSGITRDVSYWGKNAQGKRVFIKGEDWRADHANPNEFGSGHREALYHNLAKDFYGLGQYVVPTGVIRNPRTDQLMTVIEHTPGSHFDYMNDEGTAKHQAQLKALADSGDLHKIALMNMINDNGDRHQWNWLLPDEGGIKLIDHGRAFSEKSYATRYPDYLERHAEHTYRTPLHPAAVKWLQSLKPDELDAQMRRHSVPEKIIDETRRRLKAVQLHVRQPTTLDDALMSPFRIS